MLPTRGMQTSRPTSSPRPASSSPAATGRRRLLRLLGAGVLAAAAAGGLASPATGSAYPLIDRFAPRVVPGADGRGAVAGATAAAAGSVHPVPPLAPSATGTSGCSDRSETNVRVNTDCTNQDDLTLLTRIGPGQQQSSASIAVDPTNPRRLIATSNDYRNGDSACGADWSLDGGRHWGSRTAPLSFTSPGFTAPRHYWDVGGLSKVGFDSRGTAYLVCNAIDRGTTADNGDAATGIVAFRSVDGGASWSFPGTVVAEVTGTGNPANLNNPGFAVDTNPRSRFRDRLYVSWISYNPTFTVGRVTVAWSDDAGLSWHQTGDVSGRSAALCPVNPTAASGSPCDVDGFPQPVVLANGDVDVVFQNFNVCNAVHPSCGANPRDNHDQILAVHSTDGGRSFAAPTKVADYYEWPDCFTYTHQDEFAPCLPTHPLSQRSIFEGSNYPSPVATRTGLAVTFGSFINPHSNPARGNCAPAGVSATTGLNLFRGVGRPGGCNNDILVSTSTDGVHFTGASTPVWRLPALSGDGFADQWWQWAAPTPDGGFAVTFYDRRYGADEATGALDVTLRRGDGDFVRVTDRHLPPANEFPDTNGFSVFMGDYLGLAVGSDGVAHPLWMDTRNPDYVVNQANPRRPTYAGQGTDLYTARVAAG